MAGADSVFLLVRERADPFSDALHAELAGRGWPCRPLGVAELAELRLELTPHSVRVDGAPLRSLWFSAPPASGFVEDDRGFCDAETSALWLALHQHPAVQPGNAIDAEVWYCRSEWATWYRRFREAGLPVGAVEVGRWSERRPWLPWGGGEARLPGPRAAGALLAAQPECSALARVLVCRGEPLAPACEGVHAAAKQLSSWGIQLAELPVGERGELYGCSAFPRSAGGAAEAAQRIAEGLGA